MVSRTHFRHLGHFHLPGLMVVQLFVCIVVIECEDVRTIDAPTKCRDIIKVVQIQIIQPLREGVFHDGWNDVPMSIIVGDKLVFVSYHLYTRYKQCARLKWY